MKTWHYDQHGTPASCTQSELTEKLRSGQLPASTLVWSEGMPNWRPASEFAELAGASSVATATLPPPVNPYAASVAPAQALSSASVDIPFIPVKRPSFKLLLGFAISWVVMILANSATTMCLTIPLALSDPELANDQVALQTHIENSEIYPWMMASSWLSYALLLGFAITFAVIVYRAWRCIGACPTPFPSRKPGVMAAVFLIPVVNLVGMFFALPGFARRWEFIRMQNLRAQLPPLSVGLFKTTCILTLLSWIPFVVIAAFICSLLVANSFCKAINAANACCAANPKS